MPLILADRVQETGTANTTVSFTLAGAVFGFRTFAVVGNSNTTYYAATDAFGNWEVGLGTYSTTGPTLVRTTPFQSSGGLGATTFSGTVNVFITYLAGTAVYLDPSSNVSPLGTISSGTWQGSTIDVAYGGTGVTTSSGANSVVLRDSNSNITVNRINQGIQTITASGGTTTLTAASQFNQALVGTGGHTFKLPDATTLTDTTAFQFNNNATGTLTITNNAGTTVGTVAAGGAAGIALLSNATVGGTWDVHAYIPENVTWGTNALALGSTVITGGTWQGGTIQPAYGGTGLTSFTTNGAVYATGTTTLTSGTLPVISGGTGAITTPTNGQLLIGNGTNYTVASLGSGTGISTTTGSGTLTINNTGVTALAGTSPVNASASTGSVTVSLASGYGDTQNPYASKTANFFLAAPNGSAGAPTFRAIVAADVPTLNQNTTGTAANITASSNTTLTSLANLATVGTITSGTWSASFGAVSGANLTNLTAGNLSGTIPSAVLGNSTAYVGTTAVALNRASANQALTGITSVTFPGSSSGSVQLIPTAAAGTGTVLTMPATTGTVVTTGDTGTVTSTMILDGTIVNADINASAAIAVSKLSASTISGVTLGNNLSTLTMGVSGTGLSGSTTYNGSGAATFTVTSNATSANTASTIVARDASGNFTAGTITATLSGNATNVSGTVAVANGGTGTTTLTANNVILGNGASAVQFVAPSTSGNVLTSNGTTWTSAAAAGGFAAGTVMLFGQTAAPTGWTKDTTNYNNSALRVVTGSAATGGTVDFTTAFASQTPAGTVGATTLTTTQIPSHTHTIGQAGCLGGNGYVSTTGSGATLNTGSTGGGGSHTHTFTGTAINLAVKYVDVIRATKN